MDLIRASLDIVRVIWWSLLGEAPFIPLNVAQWYMKQTSQVLYIVTSSSWEVSFWFNILLTWKEIK